MLPDELKGLLAGLGTSMQQLACRSWGGCWLLMTSKILAWLRRHSFRLV